ncbi:ImmA/IrrE family metallo-endopeptidase [Methanobrevibacter sp.]|uniref:ImmA/IrrE family metallo-endopeptidase n=1 Tax=Methanobrevibacter sp. TaxID=66852 RepID=UPI0025FC4BC4|nr:ImmA/IrrE family metallo-endopeptidase [Methanobrevibacter sp.]MBQ6511570.1 ImmA/IrrE family metallo-endopeptidase [Methanobrevibacter sp.]
MNQYQLNEKAMEFRSEIDISHFDPIDFFPLITHKIKDLTIVFLDMDSDISGACCKFDSQKIIFINSNHSKGRQTFTAAHEIYHLSCEDEQFTICNLNNADEIERTADAFASFLLIPTPALYKYKKENNIEKWNLDNIIECEQYYQISHEALLFRLKNAGDISNDEYDEYKPNVKQNALRRGYDTSLYEPYISKNYTIGNYARLVGEVFEKDLISKARKDEYLLDAFLSDLVYDMEDL